MPDAQPPLATLATVASSRASSGKKRSAKKGWVCNKRGERWLARAWDPIRRKYSSETFDTALEGEKWAKLEHAKFDNGMAKAGRLAMRTVADQYLAELARQGASDGHVAFATGVVRDFADKCPDLSDADRVVEFTRLKLTGLKGKDGEPTSANSRNNVLKILKAIGNFGVMQGQLVANPFNRLGAVPVVESLKAVFSLPELGRLVDPANADHAFYPVFAAMIYTGFRSREVRHIEHDWFVWDSMRICMRITKKARARTSNEGFIPKGRHVRRARLTRLMAEHAAIVRPHANLAGYLFPDLQPKSNKAFQVRFNAYLAHCGVEIGERTPHSTRHTWTCLMLASGENETLVQQYAGHSEKEMTAHYALQQDLFRHQVEKAGWPRGELRLFDFLPTKLIGASGSAHVVQMPQAR